MREVTPIEQHSSPTSVKSCDIHARDLKKLTGSNLLGNFPRGNSWHLAAPLSLILQGPEALRHCLTAVLPFHASNNVDTHFNGNRIPQIQETGLHGMLRWRGNGLQQRL